MKTKVLLVTLGLAAPLLAQTQSSFDYWQYNREMIRRGQQAVFMCNGLFVSNRTLEQVFEQELAYLPEPVGTAAGGDYIVDNDRRAVAIGKPDVCQSCAPRFAKASAASCSHPINRSTISTTCRFWPYRRRRAIQLRSLGLMATC